MGQSARAGLFFPPGGGLHCHLALAQIYEAAPGPGCRLDAQVRRFIPSWISSGKKRDRHFRPGTLVYWFRNGLISVPLLIERQDISSLGVGENDPGYPRRTGPVCSTFMNSPVSSEGRN